MIFGPIPLTGAISWSAAELWRNYSEYWNLLLLRTYTILSRGHNWLTFWIAIFSLPGLKSLNSLWPIFCRSKSNNSDCQKCPSSKKLRRNEKYQVTYFKKALANITISIFASFIAQTWKRIFTFLKKKKRMSVCLSTRVHRFRFNFFSV